MKKGIVSLIVLFIGFAAVVTTYFMSNTYAKYTETFDGVTSEAKVAKWDISVNGLSSVDNTTDAEFIFNLFDSDHTYRYSETAYDDCKKAANDNNTTFFHCAYNMGTEITNGDVKAGMIAPGTAGEWKFKIENKSDVYFRIANVVVDGTDATKLYGNGISRINFCLDGDLKTETLYGTPGALCARGIDGLKAIFARALSLTEDEDDWDDPLFGFNAKNTTSPDQKEEGIYDAVHSISWFWEYSESAADDVVDTKIGKYAAEHPEENVGVSFKITLTLEQAM